MGVQVDTMFQILFLDLRWIEYILGIPEQVPHLLSGSAHPKPIREELVEPSFIVSHLGPHLAVFRTDFGLCAQGLLLVVFRGPYGGGDGTQVDHVPGQHPPRCPVPAPKHLVPPHGCNLPASL